MAEAIYEKLAGHLDRLPAGFPRTESGVELRILRKLFDAEEAGLACHLQMMPEPAEAIAARTGRTTSWRPSPASLWNGGCCRNHGLMGTEAAGTAFYHE